MASVEKYLWLFEYRRHGQDYVWWAYFKDERAVGAYIEEIKKLFPCVEFGKFVECRNGLSLGEDYLHYRLSSQAQADVAHAQVARKRRRQLFPLAPLTCDLLASFVLGAGEAGMCGMCGLVEAR